MAKFNFTLFEYMSLRFLDFDIGVDWPWKNLEQGAANGCLNGECTSALEGDGSTLATITAIAPEHDIYKVNMHGEAAQVPSVQDSDVIVLGQPNRMSPLPLVQANPMMPVGSDLMPLEPPNRIPPLQPSIMPLFPAPAVETDGLQMLMLSIVALLFWFCWPYISGAREAGERDVRRRRIQEMDALLDVPRQEMLPIAKAQASRTLSANEAEFERVISSKGFKRICVGVHFVAHQSSIKECVQSELTDKVPDALRDKLATLISNAKQYRKDEDIFDALNIRGNAYKTKLHINSETYEDHTSVAVICYGIEFRVAQIETKKLVENKIPLWETQYETVRDAANDSWWKTAYKTVPTQKLVGYKTETVEMPVFTDPTVDSSFLNSLDEYLGAQACKQFLNRHGECAGQPSDFGMPPAIGPPLGRVDTGRQRSAVSTRQLRTDSVGTALHERTRSRSPRRQDPSSV